MIRDKRKRIDPCGGIHPYGLGHSAFLVLAKCSFPYLVQRLFSMAGDKGGDGGVHLFSCAFGEMEVVSFAHAVEAAQKGIAGDDAGSGDGGVGVLRLCFKMDAGDHLILSLQIAVIAFFLYELVDDDVVRQSLCLAAQVDICLIVQLALMATMLSLS